MALAQIDPFQKTQQFVVAVCRKCYQASILPTMSYASVALVTSFISFPLATIANPEGAFLHSVYFQEN